jgi:Protein of unknown function DUF262/Protein of unknown function (DUF1524)
MPDAQTHIGFEQLGLGTALKQNQLFVPPNQREYAWTEDEVRQMFRDFAKAMNEDTPYFLGTIVTIPRGNDALEVADGQQRLATTALLLAAIRDYLKGRNETMLVESINNEFLTGIKRRARDRVPKLALNIDDNDLFKAIVAGNGFDSDAANATRSSNELLLDAYREAQKHVKRIVSIVDEKEHGDFLDRWVTFIEHDAQVVLLKVPNPADAYKMFETLNDRGLRVSQADLVKNYLFSKSGARFTEVQNKWSYMRGALEALDQDDITINFLRHALVLQRGYLSAADVYDAVQGIVRSEQSAVTFASQLEALSIPYVATFNPEHERWNTYPHAARKAIEVFNLVNIRPMRALLLAIAARMNAAEGAAAYSFLVSVSVRLLIATTVRSGSVETPLSSAARDIYEGSITTAAELKHSLSHLTPTDSQFQEAFERARVTSAKIGRYYLRSLERAAKGEHEPWFQPEDDKAIINLEHVLPEKPEENWDHIPEADVQQYAKRLGNLALMQARDNSNLRSASFEDKRMVYKDSPYVLTSQIALHAHWTVDDIVGRQKQLAQLAIKAWPTS